MNEGEWKPETQKSPWLFLVKILSSSFSEEVLQRCALTHVLVSLTLLHFFLGGETVRLDGAQVIVKVNMSWAICAHTHHVHGILTF